MPTSLRITHLLLTVQTVVVVLLSLNRLGDWTQGFVAGNEFLRWVDLHNMLTLPLISLVAFYLLKQHLESSEQTSKRRAHLAVGLLFFTGAYLLGASYGNHEITNYLHERFCLDTPDGTLCSIVIFNDDEFSHWVFFTGFTFVNVSMMLVQTLFPHRAPLRRADVVWLAGNGLAIALGIFANLAFEPIGFDLYVVLMIAIFAQALLWWPRGERDSVGRRQPLLVYFSTAYTVGLVATFLVKLAG